MCGKCAHRSCLRSTLPAPPLSTSPLAPLYMGSSTLWALGLTDCSSNPGFAASLLCDPGHVAKPL